jgi:hypothetical protein
LPESPFDDELESLLVEPEEPFDELSELLAPFLPAPTFSEDLSAEPSLPDFDPPTLLSVL